MGGPHCRATRSTPPCAQTSAYKLFTFGQGRKVDLFYSPTTPSSLLVFNIAGRFYSRSWSCWSASVSMVKYVKSRKPTMRERRRAWRRGLEVRYTPYAEPGPSKSSSPWSSDNPKVLSPLKSTRSMTELFSRGFRCSLPSPWNNGCSSNPLLVTNSLSPQEQQIHVNLTDDDSYYRCVAIFSPFLHLVLMSRLGANLITVVTAPSLLWEINPKKPL